jgi:hypothetical protein
MKVRLRQVAASPAGVFPAGSIVDFPSEVAAYLLKTEQCDPVEGEKAIELAVERPVVEQAVAPSPKTSKKKVIA